MKQKKLTSFVKVKVLGKISENFFLYIFLYIRDCGGMLVQSVKYSFFIAFEKRHSFNDIIMLFDLLFKLFDTVIDKFVCNQYAARRAAESAEKSDKGDCDLRIHVD